DSKNGRIGVDYCNQLYRLERKFKKLQPSERRKARQKESKPIVEAFFKWIDESPFYGKNALAKAAEYTLKHAECLKAFLYDGRIEMDNNPAITSKNCSFVVDVNKSYCRQSSTVIGNSILQEDS
uniref:IS66 family transposase n=1 Tax=Ureibacillus thermosphaericus TaxID=51173 RepID=UPI001EE63781